MSVALLALTGCGVAKYESDMLKSEARVQRFDEENRLLGSPLTFPQLPKGSPSPPFLRPPLGISPTAKKDEVPYHYQANSGVCLDVYVALDDDPKKVEKRIEDYFEVPVQSWSPATINPPNRAAITFEAVEFYDPKAPANSSAPALYDVYVHQSVGVVFHFLQAKREAAKPSMQMSMETYADGNEAFKAAADFSKRGPR